MVWNRIGERRLLKPVTNQFTDACIQVNCCLKRKMCSSDLQVLLKQRRILENKRWACVIDYICSGGQQCIDTHGVMGGDCMHTLLTDRRGGIS